MLYITIGVWIFICMSLFIYEEMIVEIYCINYKSNAVFTTDYYSIFYR